MSFSEIKNCNDCSYNSKCLFRVDQDLSICPVEKKKEELSKVD